MLFKACTTTVIMKDEPHVFKFMHLIVCYKQHVGKHEHCYVGALNLV